MECDPTPIQCGSHLLDPEVTIDTRFYAARLERRTQRFIQDEPRVIVRCKKCGREARTNQYTVVGIPVGNVWP